MEPLKAKNVYDLRAPYTLYIEISLVLKLEQVHFTTF